MLNHCVLMGRVATDLDLKSVPVQNSGEKRYVSLNLAVQRGYLNADGSRTTDFIHCVAWGGTAEFICKYFSKGRMMIVSGELRCRSYLKNNEKRSITELLITKVDFSGEAAKPSTTDDSFSTPVGAVGADELLYDDGVMF